MRQNPFAFRTNPAAVLVPLLLVLAPLVFGRWTTEAFTYNKAVVLQLAALALVGLAAPVRVRTALQDAFRDPAAAGVLLFGLSAVVSTVVSVSPRTSLQGAPESYSGLGVVLAYVVVFFAARAALGSFAGVRVVFRAAAVAAAGVAVYALLQATGVDPMGWDGISAIAGFVRPFSTLGHPNFLGGYLAMALPLLLYLAGRARERGSRRAFVAWSVTAALAATAIVLSLSRAAWLAVVCGVAVVTVSRPWPRFRRWRLVAGLFAVGVAVVVVAAVFGGQGFARGIAVRLRAFTEGEGRSQIWQTAWLVFTDHPWLGSGLDTFALVFGSRQPLEYWHIEWSRIPTKAHNELLHTLATQGLLGILALLTAAGGLAVAAARAWRRADAAERPAWAAAVAGLVAFAVQVQFGFAEPGCGVLAVCLAGVLAGLAAPRVQPQTMDLPAWPIQAGAALAALVFAVNALAGGLASFGGSHTLASLVFATAVCLVATITGRDDVPAVALQPKPVDAASPAAWLMRAGWTTLAVGLALWEVVPPYLAECASMAGELAHENNPGEELRDCRSAVALAPGYALGWTRLAAANRLAAARESSLAERRKWLGLALEAIDQAVALVPADPTHHANRGRVLGARTVTGSGEADAALAEFDTAIAMAPHNLVFRADAGQTAIDCGKPERARKYFEAGRAIDPNFARFLAGLGAVELAEGHPGEAIAWLLTANSLHWYGDNVGYERLPAQLAAAHLAARNAADAEQWAREAVRFHPEEAVPHWMLAGALELEGHTAEAAGEYRTVLQIAPSWRPAREALHRLGGGPH